MPAAADDAPAWLGQSVRAAPAGIPTLATPITVNTPTASAWSPPPFEEFRHYRTHAGWERLEQLANAGDRDALVFLTLMRAGAIPGAGRVRNAAAP